MTTVLVLQAHWSLWHPSMSSLIPEAETRWIIHQRRTCGHWVWSCIFCAIPDFLTVSLMMWRYWEQRFLTLESEYSSILIISKLMAVCSVRFPTSRFDIYKNDPALYTEALNNPNITSDIPNELKILIRMLLSIDPSKRPSCNEILTKLRSIRRDETASIFQDIPSEWNGSPTSTAAQPASPSRNPTATTAKSPSPLNDTIIVNAEVIDPSDFSQQRPATKHRHSSSAMSKDRGSPTSSDSNTLRKRQRLLGKMEVDEDIVMAESNQDDGHNEEEMLEAPRLLLGSPGLDEPHHPSRWLSDHHSIQIIKIVTVVLKVI